MSSAAANATPTSPLFNWLGTRAAGVLLHPTALPGDQGIGTFDEHAVRFLDFLQAAGLKYWQLCPLGPTGYGDSPYQSFSAFAGNPYLIDLKALVAAKFLTPAEIAPATAGSDNAIPGLIAIRSAAARTSVEKPPRRISHPGSAARRDSSPGGAGRVSTTVTFAPCACAHFAVDTPVSPRPSTTTCLPANRITSNSPNPVA